MKFEYLDTHIDSLNFDKEITEIINESKLYDKLKNKKIYCEKILNKVYKPCKYTNIAYKRQIILTSDCNIIDNESKIIYDKEDKFTDISMCKNNIIAHCVYYCDNDRYYNDEIVIEDLYIYSYDLDYEETDMNIFFCNIMRLIDWKYVDEDYFD